LQNISPTLLKYFTHYCRWYARRNFHGIRLSRSGIALRDYSGAIVVYLNHASWWDPIIGLLLAQHFWPQRQHFAPIDAAALGRYQFFSKIGFFGVEAGTARGAATFLRTSRSILQSANAALWITGEGRFRDPRTRPVELRPGLAHLARRTDALFLPLAIEYPFWEERFPEALCRFGQPIQTTGAKLTTDQWNHRLSESMQQNQDTLASEAIARKPESFQPLLGGSAGVGAIYDSWRWMVAKIKGDTFQRRHGDKLP
jgi:1-acyl-sn-glycerol-3-phosphate acyltransferase